MKIIGKLLKKTTEIGYKRINRKQLSYQNQLNVLSDLLHRAQNTTIGFYHDFKSIASKNDVVTQFQNSVPIMDYEEFYEKWLHKTISGQKDCTWPGKIKYFALSSGTTGSPSKRIPISLEMIRSFQKSSMRQVSILHTLDLDDYFFNAAPLAIGGSTQLKKIQNRYEGDLSGILKKHTSLFVRPITKPGPRISSISDWNDKLNAIVDIAPKWDIGLIAGIPSWCLMLMERIVTKYEVNTIHDIWPNLNVYVHGGVFMDPYIERLKKLSSKPIILLDTYLASEGYFAYQMAPNQKGMKLLLNNNIFFEFIPFDSRFFNEDGELISNHKALTISEVKENVDYAMVISTNAGLWRYILGDLVRFTDVRDSRVIISGRIKQFLSLCGEHLSLDNINQALINVNKKKHIIEPEFTIYVDKENQLHHWFLEITDSKIDQHELIMSIDKSLCELNDDYKSARKYTLSEPVLTILEPGTIYEYMKSLSKFGSQNKMPRVLNENQAIEWMSFLSKHKKINES